MEGCLLEVNQDYPPIIVNETDPKNLYIIKFSNKTMILKETDLILLLCPGGMKLNAAEPTNSNDTNSQGISLIAEATEASPLLSSDPVAARRKRENTEEDLTLSPPMTAAPSTATNISVTCKNGQLIGTNMDGVTLNSFTAAKCETKNRFEIFMKVGHGTCSHNYYAIGIKLHENVYEFVQICFDLRGMKPTFVRFLAGRVRVKLSSYKSLRALDHKEKWWERDQRYKTIAERKFDRKKTSDYIDLELPNYNFFIPSNKIQILQKEKFGKYSDIVFYQEVNLYPTEFFGNFFRGIIPEKFKLQTTVGWDPLFMGNWRIFFSDLAVRMRNVTYELYIGTSHIAQKPKTIDCVDLRDLILEDNGREIAIPQYIWAYLISANERIVIIGVNTPYYPVLDQSNPIPCESICNKVPWLTMLKKFARVSTFGLIYCCPVSSVEKFLHGFPKFAYPQDN